MPPKAVSTGQEIQIKARHDTYGISFEYESVPSEKTKVSRKLPFSTRKVSISKGIFVRRNQLMCKQQI